MLNKEVVQEFFIEAPHRDENGKFSSIPAAGMFILDGLHKSWLKADFPKGQFPMVSAGPKVLSDGREGYSIRKEIVHK